MNVEDAENELSKFASLIGRECIIIPGKITDIIVTFTDEQTANIRFEDFKNNRNFNRIKKDINCFTLAAVIDGASYISVRALCEEDNIEDLIQKAQALDYISPILPLHAVTP